MWNPLFTDSHAIELLRESLTLEAGLAQREEGSAPSGPSSPAGSSLRERARREEPRCLSPVGSTVALGRCYSAGTHYDVGPLPGGTEAGGGRRAAVVKRILSSPAFSF